LEENMNPAPGTSPEKGRIDFSRLTENERIHILKDHLTVIFDKDKDRVEISYVCGCKTTPCHSPRTTVAFFVCPSKPCPPPIGLDG
jgi:hypothetical protein